MIPFLVGSVFATTVLAYLSDDVKDKLRQGAKQVLMWLDRPATEEQEE